jgi:hypothetical protein
VVLKIFKLARPKGSSELLPSFAFIIRCLFLLLSLTFHMLHLSHILWNYWANSSQTSYKWCHGNSCFYLANLLKLQVKMICNMLLTNYVSQSVDNNSSFPFNPTKINSSFWLWLTWNYKANLNKTCHFGGTSGQNFSFCLDPAKNINALGNSWMWLAQT